MNAYDQPEPSAADYPDNVIELPTEDPHNAREAELALISAALNGADLDELFGLVQPVDFANPVHEQVWEIIGDLHLRGIRPDFASVGQEAMARKVRGVDPAQLYTWQSAPVVPSSGAWFAEQVRTASGLRALGTAAVKVAQIARTPGELAERREQARQAIDAACQGRDLSRARQLAALLDDVLDVAERGAEQALSTPWPDLDRLIGGIAPGRLIVVAARPGVGKSVALVNLALHVASRYGHAVHLASLEMPEREVGQRMLAAYATAQLGRLMTGTTDPDEWRRIEAKYGELTAMPIFVDDASDQTIPHIRAAVRDLSRRRDDVALVCVDYLQLVRVTERRSNRAEEVAEISRGLKLLARESGACVVAAAQLNREAAKRDKPMLTDLRESGAIEADADQVVLMHQPDDEVPEVELLVEKNRHGPRGMARLQIAGSYAQLRSIAWTATRGIR